MTEHQIATLISNGMTVVTIIMAVAVVRLWWHSAVIAYRERKTHKFGPTEWFIIGVFAGFLGSALDNLYWLIPWSASFLNLSITDVLMHNGVYFNIPFRQGFGIIAAYCHIRSALEFQRKHSRTADHILKYAALAGIAYSIGMVTAWTGPLQ